MGVCVKFSDRVYDMEYSAIRKLSPFAKEAKARGIEVHHLNIGAPDVETPREFFKAIASYEEKTLAYADSAGLLDLRQAMSDYYKKLGIDFRPNEIVITVGASEALLFCLMAMCNPGDEILTADPYYSNYKTYMDQTGVKINTYPTSHQDAFALPSKEEIVAHLTDKTKAILVCNPANPTGSVCTEKEIRMLIEVAVEHDVFIIADEIYQDFIFDGRKFLSFAEFEEAQDRVVVLDSISKRYSACGARVGAIMSKNQEFVKMILKLATGRLAAPTLEQVGTAALYRMENDYLERVKKEYQERRDLVYNMLSKIPGVKTYKSQGAFYTIAGLPVEDADHFAKWLLTDFSVDNETVVIAPASGFYNEEGRGKNEARIAFAISQEDIKRSLEILEIALDEYNKTR